jgi:hypothetical protein
MHVKASLNLEPAEEILVQSELALASASIGVEGVYAPYLQMFLDHIWDNESGLRIARKSDAQGVGTALNSVAAFASLVNLDDKVTRSCENTFT